MATFNIDTALAGPDANRRSEISARYGTTTPHFDLLPGFAQRHSIALPPGFARVAAQASQTAGGEG